ncbi:hypothetical protein [Flavobacterium lacisediminis]|uniref:Choline dehydrogenase n=1 Tax=Flavobacterium lacisediminis TaxID=2989705 RepID=A0ABT3EJU3_9FLAO|nr:hypothetical protein [Flavobacterium lacisediminis]MCW1148827.1 hypothetical protein [Flavobacterium lacisediminis]
MELNYDYIVVGSGATGAIASHFLVESGVTVAVLDVGIEDTTYKNQIPSKDFLSIRKEEEEQYRYFLGERFEGIPWGKGRVGSQLTPPRGYLTQAVEKYIPFSSSSFFPMESLAKGGLGGGWGLGCYVFSELELRAIGLNDLEMQTAYEKVASYIGISGSYDDSNPYCLRDLKSIMPSSKIEHNLEGIFSTYHKKKNKLNDKGFYLGRSALALLTEDKGDRKAVAYKDMDFWSDTDKSAYRSWITIDELNKKTNFVYHSQCLVLKFEELDNQVKVFVKRTDTNEEQVFTCKKLILSPGVLGTARIVSRSFEYKKQKLPIICNPYSYIPCIQWKMLGKIPEQYKTSLGQLVLYLDENQNNLDVSIAALFSYRSLLLFKLIKESPLNFRDSRFLMQYLQSSFTIAGIHHSEKGSTSKYIQLLPDDASFTLDKLIGEYIQSDQEIERNFLREKKFKSALGLLGCLPLKTVNTTHGGSIHYVGTLPFDTTGSLFSLFPNGKLAGTQNVYVADGSGFKYLPGKGLTLTLMANAYNVAKNVLKNE